VTDQCYSGNADSHASRPCAEARLARTIGQYTKGEAVTAILYSFVGAFSRGLEAMAHILTKGAEFTAAAGVSEADMLEWRLAEDMLPLRLQIRFVCDYPKQFCARAADLPVPESIGDTHDLAGYLAEIAKAKAYLATIKSEQFARRDDVVLTVNMGQMEMTRPVDAWVTGFALGNFYFHLTTAYGILRAHGVQLGKRDFFAGGF
jgi:hypothetical protein